ncbi:transposon Ty3-I Gag-Pol polyprotein [Elysia marginata]|uniref:Transposon Ty3-I Gag-Pol polyprotein n=1 Tax=Elysia marginata TaxID=1093978 RepID=A0AAV4J977_9GAST|nr:transposon Ty3-I Gag-Pol polyprotein [Elysia marginata]
MKDHPQAALPYLLELGGWSSNETVNNLQYGDQLIPDQRRQLEEIVSSYSSIFSDRLGIVSTEEHRIELTSSTPVRQRPYPVPYAMRQALRDELRKMEDLGIIRKTSPPYSSPVLVVKKKDGSNRVCNDYRRLNKITTFDPQRITPPADIFQAQPQNPSCTVNENTGSGDITSVTVTCFTSKVYTKAKCSFSRKINGGNSENITKTPLYIHTETGATPVYYRSQCSVNVPVEELGEGTHRNRRYSGLLQISVLSQCACRGAGGGNTQKQALLRSTTVLSAQSMCL